MLPASNKGVGMNMGFPDVCLTPAGPAVVPIPYPNMAMNAMAAPFCPTILLTMMPALNMGSIIPMTLGDQPGVANPLLMQMGRYTMGNPTIMLQGLPAINLTCPTSGNMMNNPLGAVLVPSATNVMFAWAQEGAGAGSIGVEALAELGERLTLSAEATAAAVAWELLPGGVGYVAIRLFSAAVPSAVHHAVRGLAAAEMGALVLDLRGNPGGELGAFIALAGDFLPRGSLVVTMTDGDGDDTAFRTHHDGCYAHPVVILVDRGTASAAELFAGCLQASGRAVVVGETTHGKGFAQAALPAREGDALYATVARFTLPDGRSIQGAGVAPDVAWSAGDPQRFGLDAARLPPRVREALVLLAQKG